MRVAVGRPARGRSAAILVAALIASVATGGLPAADAAAAVPNPDPTLISRWQPCEPEAGVTVIVDFQSLGAHDVKVGCAPGQPENGAEALFRAGFAIAGTDNYGLGFICRIDELPSVAETSCHSTPPASAYWEYWHGRPGGQWEYSGTGALGYKPRQGTVEGWSFAQEADPGAPGIRIPPQDGSGASLRLPATYPSSAIQLRLAQEWLARGLRNPPSAREDLQGFVADAAALARTGYPMAGPEFGAARELLADPTTAHEYAYFSADSAEPRPDRLAPYAIALGALEGGAPLLADGSNMRVWMLEDVEAGTGKVLVRRKWEESTREGGLVLEALARTGRLPARGTALAQMIERNQEAGGEFGETVALSLPAVRGLRAAEGSGGPDAGAALARAAAWVASLQEADGGVRRLASAEAQYKPTVGSTAAGASILALGGDAADAARAARWISPYQVTAELAGGGPNSTTGGPGSPEVGGFASSLEGLAQVLRYGGGPRTGVEESTPAAAEALTVAPWLDPVAARVSAGTALTIGTAEALVAGSVETGTSSQSVSVELGTTEAYGQTVGGPDVVAEFGQSPVEVELTGLTPGTTYHYRLVATAPGGGTVAGPDGTFTTKGTPPAAPAPTPGPSGTPAAAPAHGPAALAAVRRRAARLLVGPRGIVRVATVSCPAGAGCRIRVPARVAVRIGGRRFAVAVLVPRAVAAGKSVGLRARVPRPAVRALAGRGVPLAIPVTVSGAAGSRTALVKTRLVGGTGR